jgi:Transcriptional regulator
MPKNKPSRAKKAAGDEPAKAKPDKTIARLLRVASEEFAENGWSNTTASAVCAKAGANAAAVNYYFGDKEGLYRAVWDRAVELAIDSSRSPEMSSNSDREWLYKYLRLCVLSVFAAGEGGLLPKLIANEITDPSPISNEVLSEHLAPRIKDLETHLRSMLGQEVSDFQIGCCILAIHSQFSALTINRSARRNLFKNDAPTSAEADHFTREICAFIIGGIRAIHATPENRRSKKT